jgi:hypothetical protein
MGEQDLHQPKEGFGALLNVIAGEDARLLNLAESSAATGAPSSDTAPVPLGHRDTHCGALEDAECFVRYGSRIPIAPAPPPCNAHFDARLAAEPNTAHISPAAAKPLGPRRGNQIDGYQHTDYEQTDGKLSHTCPCGLLRLDS